MTQFHPAIDAFQKEHERFLAEADSIRTTLEKDPGRRALRALVKELLLFEETDFRDHLAEEEAVLLCVIREHLADTHPQVIDEDRAIRGRLAGDLEALRHGHKTGQDAKNTLSDMERVLREYVDYEEKTLLPWAKKNLGDILLSEVDARYRAYREGPREEVAVDLAALKRT